MEYLLVNQNWFYLYGIIFIIASIKGIIKNCKKFEGIKKQGGISNLLFYSTILWLIFGIINHERMLFLALSISYVILPILLHLGDFKNIVSKSIDNSNAGGGAMNEDDVLKCIDVENFKKQRRFHALCGLIEIFICVAIIVNHFKYDIFYATL